MAPQFQKFFNFEEQDDFQRPGGFSLSLEMDSRGPGFVLNLSKRRKGFVLNWSKRRKAVFTDPVPAMDADPAIFFSEFQVFCLLLSEGSFTIVSKDSKFLRSTERKL
jgi:hypothetical protein